MEFIELQAFVTVAEERSFSRAAVRLLRTQPAVSQAIRRLEDELGERLFDRASKTTGLTEAGRVLLEYAGRLCALREEARQAVADLRALKRGHLVIGANEALISTLLPVIEEFRQDHAAIRVDVRRVRARDVVGDIKLGDLDFGVVAFRPDDRAIEAVPIATDDVVLVVPPAHRLARVRSVRLKELAWEAFIAHNARSWCRDRVQAIFESAGLQPRVGLVLPTLDAMKRAVERGMGVTLMPRSAVLTEVVGGQLSAVSVDEPGLSRQIWLVHGRESARSAAAVSFLELAQRNTAAAAPVAMTVISGARARGPRVTAMRSRQAAQ
jgi:DNA-binding transcriptional LysR family regulator